MATFSPPIVDDSGPVSFDANELATNPLGFRLFRHYKARARGRTVLKSVGGVYSTVDTPSQDQIDAAAVCYLGGHVYSVSSAEAAALTAAGYGAYLS